MKYCSKCTQSKNEVLFSKGQAWCKCCVREHQSSRKEDKKNYNKEYHAQNKEKANTVSRQYKINHKEEITSYNTQYHFTRRKNDAVFNLRGQVSRAIGKSLKRLGSTKNGTSSSKYLSYSIRELKEYLEKQFEPWMTWNNWGKYDPKIWNDNDQSTWTWQIDHIIPQSKLPYTTMTDNNFQICWALSNLRPLSAKQNLLDGVYRKRHINE
jgi:hypothetical protein